MKAGGPKRAFLSYDLLNREDANSRTLTIMSASGSTKSYATSDSEPVYDWKKERMNEIFKESNEARRRAIMEGKATRAEIIKYEEETGDSIPPHIHARAIIERVPSLSRSRKTASSSRKRSADSQDESTSDSDSESSKTKDPPPSKRRKTASERKPRKFVTRSTKEGCYPTCISRDHHNHEWGTREADMEAFQAFADECLVPFDDLSLRVTGKAMRAAYEEYHKSTPEARKLGPNEFGFCCARRFCKTDASHVVLYRGVKLA